MKRLYIETDGTCSWRARLADPSLHWKRRASAMELAVSWELGARRPRGLPDPVERVLDAHPATRGARLLFGVPEHLVSLPGGSRASQTDLWAVLRGDQGWISLAVEGKAREPFGPTLKEWLRESTPGKRARISALCQTLGVQQPVEESEIRYQLFHRAASAIIEASRIGAGTAMLLVQNFYADSTSWSDFESFAKLLGAVACRDGVCEVRCPAVERLLFGWTDSPTATDAELASVI